MKRYITQLKKDDKWAVKKTKTSEPIKLFKIKKDAIKFAFEMKDTTSIVVINKNGEAKEITNSLIDNNKTTEVSKKINLFKHVFNNFNHKILIGISVVSASFIIISIILSLWLQGYIGK